MHDCTKRPIKYIRILVSLSRSFNLAGRRVWTCLWLTFQFASSRVISWNLSILAKKLKTSSLLIRRERRWFIWKSGHFRVFSVINLIFGFYSIFGGFCAYKIFRADSSFSETYSYVIVFCLPTYMPTRSSAKTEESVLSS